MHPQLQEVSWYKLCILEHTILSVPTNTNWDCTVAFQMMSNEHNFQLTGSVKL